MARAAASRGVPGVDPVEEAIISKRYLTLTVSSVPSSLPPFKKLAKQYMQFATALERGSAEEAARLHGELQADLYVIQAHMAKLEQARRASEAYRREQETYAQKQAALQASIEQAEGDIEDRKGQLEAARLQLKHEKEYEAVKQKIVQVPARSATRAEMEAVEREIADLQQQGADLDAAMERRRRQFGEVLVALERVWAQLEGDSVGEEGALPDDAEPGEAPAAAGGSSGVAAAAGTGGTAPMQLG